jgi:putative iron-regulated protein
MTITSVHIALALTALALPAACTDGTSSTGKGFDDAQILADYADKLIIPTYQMLDARAIALRTTVTALQASPSQANVVAARTAWEKTREPWEQSEAHLFGPVEGNGYDPAMDSWPVERNDLDAVLTSNNPLTAQFIASLPQTQKGFHTIEYLLWGADASKLASAFNARQLDYLAALTTDLTNVTAALKTSWTAGIGGATAYREVFVTAGQGSTAYPSQVAAAQEILGGMSAIANEVANGKIADPYDAHDPEKVESQFSFNSLADFADNIRGIKAAYTGDAIVANSTGRGLDEYVVSKDAALDERFKREIDDAIAAILAIPGPFRTAIVTPSSYPSIEAAQTKIRVLIKTIDGELLPLLTK